MTLPAAAPSKLAEIAKNPKFAQFSTLVQSAAWAWGLDNIRPSRLAFGLCSDGERYTLKPLEDQNAKTLDGSRSIRMCVIGAAMLENPRVSSIRLDAASAYNLSLAEIEDIIVGFDHGGTDTPTRSGNPAAIEFGAAVYHAVFEWGCEL